MPSIGQSRETTTAEIIETVDSKSPKTKEELSENLGISTHYLSEILQELKRAGIIKKGYVVDEKAVYKEIKSISDLWSKMQEENSIILELLQRLDDVVFKQYKLSCMEFEGQNPDQTADQLEPLTNERYTKVLNELKSYTLTTDWPGNRISADLASIAKNLEIIGDRSCFISDEVNQAKQTPSGSVKSRMLDIFESGKSINKKVSMVIFKCEIEKIDQIHSEEKQVHRDLSELFELTTAYDPNTYGYLITVARALERIIHYWVNSAETAAAIYSGIDPGHVELS